MNKRKLNVVLGTIVVTCLAMLVFVRSGRSQMDQTPPDGDGLGADQSIVTDPNADPSIIDSLSADLTLVATWAPANAGRGTVITVTNVTKNIGVVSSIGCQNWIYLNTSCASGGTKGTYPIPGLSPGQVYTGSCSITVPSSIPLGTDYIVSIANGDGAAPEKTKANNTNCTPINITP